MVSTVGVMLQDGGHHRVHHRGRGIVRRGASHLVGLAGHALINKLAGLIGGSYKITGRGTHRRRTTVHHRVHRAPRLTLGYGRKRRVGRPRVHRIGVRRVARKPRLLLGGRRRVHRRVTRKIILI